MKIKTRNTKSGFTSTVNLALHKFGLPLKTGHQREKSDESDGSKKNYMWTDITTAVAYF